ncbi:TRAP transporter large permease subunit [Bosea sp. 2RAB26]|uniref:TRAP transporter large permease subunit n=1 Tax=Bosea sp. 2RAB26 TaxID=3237476 RepID=UPI003F8F2CB3
MTVAVFLTALSAAMAVGAPIAFALIFCALALMLWMGNFDSIIVAQTIIVGADNFQLLAVPFFILAGELMNAGGLSKRIINFALACLGHLRGGLGYVAILAALILAAISGSAAADTAALAAILIPIMRSAGYDLARSAGLIATGGIIAPVIPPSIGFIVFGVAANVSISQLFLAGVVPGLMMGAALVVTWWLTARKDDVRTFPRQGYRERGRALVEGFFALFMPVLIIGGIKWGIVTPTEAAVLACAYAFIIGMFVYRELKVAMLFGLLLNAAKTASAVMFLIAAALVSAWLITQANIPAELSRVLEPFMGNPTIIMILLMLLVLVVGTALDFTPTVLILTPVMMPIVKQAGIDPIYFGVLFIMNNAIGLITPPVGIVLNVVSGVSGVSMGAVMRGVWPFLVSQVVVLVLLILFPSLVLVPLAWLKG